MKAKYAELESQTGNSTLAAEKEALQKEHDKLKTGNDKLQKAYDKLKSKNERLECELKDASKTKRSRIEVAPGEAVGGGGRKRQSRGS